MAEINLEAEQVVEEEQEEAPAEKRRSPKSRKGTIIFVSVVVLEALLLFFLFEVMNGSSEGNADGTDAPEAPKYDLMESFTTDGLIDLGDVSITIDNSHDPRVDRRVSLPLKVQVDEETYQEIATATEANEHAMDLIKSALQEEVRFFLFGEGIEKLKNPEVQKRLAPRIEKHLLEKLPQLRGRLKKVFLGNVSFSRY